MLAEFAIFSKADQSVGNLSERALNRLPIGEESLLLLIFFQFYVGAKLAGVEDRLSQGGGKIPLGGAGGEQWERGPLSKPKAAVRGRLGNNWARATPI